MNIFSAQYLPERFSSILAKQCPLVTNGGILRNKTFSKIVMKQKGNYSSPITMKKVDFKMFVEEK